MDEIAWHKKACGEPGYRRTRTACNTMQGTTTPGAHYCIVTPKINMLNIQKGRTLKPNNTTQFEYIYKGEIKNSS